MLASVLLSDLPLPGRVLGSAAQCFFTNFCIFCFFEGFGGGYEGNIESFDYFDFAQDRFRRNDNEVVDIGGGWAYYLRGKDFILEQMKWPNRKRAGKSGLGASRMR